MMTVVPTALGKSKLTRAEVKTRLQADPTVGKKQLADFDKLDDFRQTPVGLTTGLHSKARQARNARNVSIHRGISTLGLVGAGMILGGPIGAGLMVGGALVTGGFVVNAAARHLEKGRLEELAGKVEDVSVQVKDQGQTYTANSVNGPLLAEM